MKKRKSAEKSSGIRSLIRGILINAAVYTALSLIFTVIAYTSDDPLGCGGYFSIASMIVCGAVCGFAVSKKSEGAYTAPLCSLIFSLIMLILGICISGKAPRIGSVVSCLIYVAVCIIFSKLASVHAARKRVRRHRGG